MPSSFLSPFLSCPYPPIPRASWWPPEPARRAADDVITGLQKGTVAASFPREHKALGILLGPFRPRRGRARMTAPGTRLADSTESRAPLTKLDGVSVVTSFAGTEAEAEEAAIWKGGPCLLDIGTAVHVQNSPHGKCVPNAASHVRIWSTATVWVARGKGQSPYAASATATATGWLRGSPGDE
ncbi:hypothetical protein BBK36DRAFT_1144743 [Trichoderma citrinoviride]|uniref:Uncharacterized protein n=1 Tax=Trichoderma citrinoviride TaxID=58853 RepID=A0A2T4AZ13_9HYPO|nr:hypothetical protein BBK36DRAFT_1144743 [Trichoderma citrinoviride]PTB62304.1 hypothetical protein BBK36DRAFT_1144743 [Trichoderma citrinoviride]